MHPLDLALPLMDLCPRECAHCSGYGGEEGVGLNSWMNTVEYNAEV